MRLSSLLIRNVRNISDERILPSPEINIIYGENAAGKTAILESISLLSKAKSFRTTRIKEVIRYQQDDLTVSGVIEDFGKNPNNTGIRKSTRKTEIKYNGVRVKAVSEQAKNVIIQTATPDNTKLLTGSPKDRRKWIDWALFHVEPDYLHIWHSYHRALRNRNALLRRQAKEEEFFVWEESMADSAKALNSMWESYLGSLQQYFLGLVGHNPYAKVVFGIKKDKHKRHGLLEYLQTTRQADIQVGHTQQGPHKVDFEFKTGGNHVNAVFSRGQIKFFVTVLAVAQAKLLISEKNITPIMLADDLTAELDTKTATLLLELFYGENMQLFITTTNPDEILKSDRESALFHVEHGRVKRC